MARDFNGSSDFMRVGASPVSGPPISIACWFDPDNISVESCLAGINDSASAADYATLEYLASGALRALSVDPGVGSAAAATTANPGSGPQHALAVFASTTDRRVYLNGTNKGTSTGSVAMSNMNRMFAAVEDNVGGAGQRFWYNGRLSRIVYWSAILNDAEALALAGGINPHRIRPLSIIHNVPTFGLQSPEPDYSGNSNDMTVTGTSRANDPPITLFTPKWAATIPFVSALGDLDTEDKRRSAMSPLTHVLMPLPDGTIAAVDRQQAAWIYSGIAAAAPAVGGQPFYIRDSYSMPDFLGNQQS